MPRIAIIGAGISGLVSAGFFKSYAPDVYEERSSAGTNHYAVMRVKDQSISKILGICSDKISVDKNICYNRELMKIGSIRLNNMYSRKVDGRFSRRSIYDLSSSDRFLIKWEDIRFPVKYGFKFCSCLDGVVFASRDTKVFASDYDFVISTIPMPDTLSVLGISFDRELFGYKSIWVRRATLTFESTVHQTVYFPDDCSSVYRATLEGRSLIIESMDNNNPEEDIELVLWSFGLLPSDIGEQAVYHQKYGKISFRGEESERKEFILRLSEKYNLFSAGRFAIWKQIRTEELVDDLEKISIMLRLTKREREYASRTY